MIDEAFLLTLQLLSQMDVLNAREQFQRHQLRFASVTTQTEMAPGEWSQWNADACERLRGFGIQEHLIAALGDEMDRWDKTPVDAAAFEQGLGRLAVSCSTSAAVTTDAMLAEDAAAPALDSNIAAFWKAVFGSAIAIAALRHDSTGSSNKLPTHAFLTQFGAHLVNVWNGHSS
jgi:hypothetical protein